MLPSSSTPQTMIEQGFEYHIWSLYMPVWVLYIFSTPITIHHVSNQSRHFNMFAFHHRHPLQLNCTSQGFLSHLQWVSNVLYVGNPKPTTPHHHQRLW